MSPELKDLPVIKSNSKFAFDDANIGLTSPTALKDFFKTASPSIVVKENSITAADNKSISFNGIIEDFLSFKNIPATCVLFDSNNGRHFILKLIFPAAVNGTGFLDTFRAQINSTIPALLKATTIDLYLQSFGTGNQIIFSSLDISKETIKPAYYTDELDQLLPYDQIQAGLNFPLPINIDDDFTFFLKSLLDINTASSGNGKCLVYIDEISQTHHIAVTTAFTAIKSFTNIALSFDSISINGSLMEADELYPLIIFEGSITIKEKVISASFEMDLYYKYLLVRVKDLPSLLTVLEYCDASLSSTCFPEPLKNFLDIKLAELSIGINLAEPALNHFALSLTTDKEIYLIEDILSFKPDLNLTIAEPFDTVYRRIEGTLTGKWEFPKATGQPIVITSLTFPNHVFTAQLTSGSLHTKDLTDKFFNNIDIPDIDIFLLELQGNLNDKSYSFKLGVDDKGSWKFNVGVCEIEIKKIEIGLSHIAAEKNETGTVISEAATQYFLSGILNIGGIDLSLSALHDMDSGWNFECYTEVGQEISAVKVAADLGKLFGLDLDTLSSVGKLNISNFKLSFCSKSKEASFNAQLNGSSDIGAIDPAFTLNNLSLSINKGDHTTCKLLADFEIVITDENNNPNNLKFDIEAEHADGWLFKANYSKNDESDGISLAGLAGSFGFGNPDLPAFVKNISIDEVSIFFQAHKDLKNKATKTDKHFKIACSDTINSTIAIELSLTLDITYAGEKESILFAGHMTINDKYVFDIIQQKSGEATLLLASYHQENETEKINLQTIMEALGIEGSPDISIGLKDALFANYAAKNKAKALSIFLADIDAGMNLSNLPLVGKMLPADATLSVALRILYASTAYAWALDDINAGLPDGISKIKKPETDDASGIDLISEVRIGTQTFNLELGINAGDTQNKNNGKSSDHTGNTSQSIKLSGSTKTIPSKQAPLQLNKSADTVAVSTGNANNDIKWIRIGKKFGPVIFNRIGINYSEGNITVYPDAALSMGGLTFTLDGLSVSSPVTEFKPTFKLKGLGFDMNNGGIEIGGSFLRRQITDADGITYDEFDGMAIIKAETFSISALGSYAYYKGNPSLFIYVYLNQALGGPSFFFVEGLAIAFGYNRRLIMPTIDEVSSFPLVRQVMEGSDPAAATDRATLLTQQLDAISKYVPPSAGDMFIAVGIKFNTFKLIDSFVMLAISFGNHLEIDVLGQSNIIVPSERPPGVPPLAQVKIQLMAKYLPDEGFLAVCAQLTKDSYILHPDCHLSGGAAFYSWFKGDHKGDFAITLGGYHPGFNVPNHYPQVPRVAFSWQLADNISIKGDMYFALCPHAFMAGGHLQALFQEGPVSAWFNAGADFLITWQPYHYDAHLYLDIGVSYTYELFGTQHLTIDLGADVHLWGPKLAGEATIHFYIFDLSVAFGSPGNTSPLPISFNEFKNKCLPDAEKIISGAITKGQHNINEHKTPIVNSKELAISLDSAVPVSKISVSYLDNNEKEITTLGTNPESLPQFIGPDNFTYNTFGIAPMNQQTGITSSLKITFNQKEKFSDSYSLLAANEMHFCFEAVTKQLPAALWGNQFIPGLNSNEKMITLVTGITITTKEPKKINETDFLTLDQLLENDPVEIKNALQDGKTLKPDIKYEADIKDPDNICVLLGLSSMAAYSY